LNGVLIMRSDEDQASHIFRANLAHNGEAVHLRHLHVQEDEIGLLVAYQAHGFAAIPRFQDEVICSMLGKKHAHGPACQRFIIHDQRFRSNVLSQRAH
jgi:hypothetical protein